MGSVTDKCSGERSSESRETDKMAQIKLTYFNVEAAAEKVRLCLSMCGKQFEDNRIAFPDWQVMKPTTPFGQLPLMEISENGSVKKIAQSEAMLRWVAISFDDTKKLYPVQDPAKLLEVEEMLGLIGDMTRAWQPALYLGMGRHASFGHPKEWAEKDEVVKALRETFVAEELPKFVQFFTDRIKASGGAFLTGSDITIADLVLLPQLRYFTKGVASNVPADCLEKFPEIVAYISRCMEVPAIKEWYANH